jgi:hypothetical protein
MTAEDLPPPGSRGLAAANLSVPEANSGLMAGTGHMHFQGGSAILTLTPASHHLLAHARTLATQGSYQFAVVFAHAACELHTEGELIRLLASRRDQLLANLLLPAEREIKSLANWDVYDVYAALTDDYPAGSKDPKRTAADWWGAWHTSRRDRHAVAHRGAQMTREQADAAVAVADTYIKHITEKAEAALKSPQP